MSRASEKRKGRQRGDDSKPTTVAVVKPDASVAVIDQSVARTKHQLEVIKQLIATVLKEGVHYGVIPGTKKPTLMKPGGEQLRFCFRLGTRLEDMEVVDLANSHREYRCEISIYDINNPSVVLAFGVGSCSTMEAKYRYRTDKGQFKPDGEVVSKEYWSAKRSNNPARVEAIARGRRVGKVPDEPGGTWFFGTYEGADRVENPDLADCYNTCMKMAKKRAEVDATLAATAASDTFTQDMEDFSGATDTVGTGPVPNGAVDAEAEVVGSNGNGTATVAVDANVDPDSLPSSGDALSVSKLASILVDVKKATPATIDAVLKKWHGLSVQLKPEETARLNAHVARVRRVATAAPAAENATPVKTGLLLLGELKDMASLENPEQYLSKWLVDNQRALDALSDPDEAATIQSQVMLLQKRAATSEGAD